VTISVCLPTTRADTVLDTVESIRRQTWSDWELVVVTQRPTAELRRLIDDVAASDGRIRHLSLGERGLSRARNAGIKASSGEVIAMIDDDAEAREDWLQTIERCFDDDAELGLVGGAVLPPSPPPPGQIPTNTPSEIRYVGHPGAHAPEGWDWIGCNFALRRTVVNEIGDFDEELGAGADFPSNEDTDYKLRLEARGVPMLTTPRSVVFHTHGARTGLQARLRHQRNYSRGAGAMAAKLTLQGDPRGEEWSERTRQECLTGWLKTGRLYNAPFEWRRLWFFRDGYRSCLAQFTVDSKSGLLALRASDS
jgi:GT2 family glycosyltransferase